MSGHLGVPVENQWVLRGAGGGNKHTRTSGHSTPKATGT